MADSDTCIVCGATIPPEDQADDGGEQRCRECWTRRLTELGWMRGGKFYGHREPERGEK